MNIYFMEKLVRMVITEPNEGNLWILIECWDDNIVYFENLEKAQNKDITPGA